MHNYIANNKNNYFVFQKHLFHKEKANKQLTTDDNPAYGQMMLLDPARAPAASSCLPSQYGQQQNNDYEPEDTEKLQTATTATTSVLYEELNDFQ